ncbi:M28 family peptidase [Algoriphagus sp. AK58]|uniref:M28 family peptidase n=1 Tax=Algoriphagus sp. AK58 TaxID=1406877 RepID=UPI00164F41B5|nr:M28 family peptidase [Algoriphagus sp. AK58]MBC6365423.1 peptidase M28 [Algoriphagus sp. AK58]
MKKLSFLLVALLSFQAFAQKVPVPASIRQAMNQIDTLTIRDHIAYLADDKLKGRLPGTEGYQMAVDYVIDQYQKIGVQPGGDPGQYTQKLFLRKTVVENASAKAMLKDPFGNVDSLVFGKDFMPVPHPLSAKASGEGKLVFVGYGVDIPGLYSDYEGVDVKGKVVVFVSGVPDGIPASTLVSHFSSPGNKMNTAIAKGAVGTILVTMGANFSNSNPVLQSNVALNPEKTTAYGRGFVGNLGFALNGSKSFLTGLFLNSGKNLNQVLADIKARKNSSFEFPYLFSASYSNTHSEFESYNVIGLIPGTDPKLKNEYVVHSAHLDHVGIGRPENGDSIFNGAHDNASGVASLLEIARVYVNGKAKPKRSVLIVMVTAEEMGLVGSAYFAANPSVPKSSIVANVNTDMPTVIAPLLSVVPLGAEHSSLMENVRFAADYLGLDVEKDPEPEQNRFVRSDQYSFVVSGIPALHIKYGNKSAIPGFDLDKFVKEWRAKYYHRAADGMDGMFNFTAAKTYVQLNFLISYSIANTPAKPVWNPGDLFGIGTN